MRIGIYPGSFDPLTKGHLDIIERASRLCDKLIIAVAINSAKKTLFSADERIEIINNCCGSIANTEVVTIDTLLVDYCKKRGINFIIRGLRSTTDFEYEYSIATANRNLAPEIETIFLMTKGEYFFISSHIVKDIASYDGDISSLVPQFVAEKVRRKFSR